MRTIRCWQDLEQFGIVALTGETCGYSMRLLCDVTEDGKRLVEAFLGGTIEIKDGSSWNNGTQDDPHVGSVLLARSLCDDLGAFALLETASEGSAVVLTEAGPAEFTAEDMSRASWKYAAQRIKRWYKRPTQVAEERNRHAMSGRLT